LVITENTSASQGTIYLAGNSRLEITDGVVSNMKSGNAIFNISSTGEVIVTGNGKALATTGSAIHNNNTGTVTVSGGEVAATGGNAIHNNSTGTVTVSGGTVRATTGKAIYNDGPTAAVLTGGLAFAYGTAFTDVVSGACDTLTYFPVIIAWNQAAGHTSYRPGQTTDIESWTAAATAVWANDGTDSGIDYANGSNTGFLILSSVTDAFCGGTGDPGDPYLICNAEQLDSVRFFLDKTFQLNNDIDLTQYINDKYPSGGWLPIGDHATPFTGNFRGALSGPGFKITGLWIDRAGTDGVGLFGVTDGAGIRFLGVEIDPLKSVNGSDEVGALAGWSENTQISYCYTTGNVSGSDRVGGLAGYIGTTSPVSKSYATGDVSGHNHVG
jgi:hypothetical protein